MYGAVGGKTAAKVAGSTTTVGLAGNSLASTGSHAVVYAIAAVTLLLIGAACVRFGRSFKKE